MVGFAWILSIPYSGMGNSRRQEPGCGRGRRSDGKQGTSRALALVGDGAGGPHRQAEIASPEANTSDNVGGTERSIRNHDPLPQAAGGESAASGGLRLAIGPEPFVEEFARRPSSVAAGPAGRCGP
jgi:hypothetical protein